jgi:hypothetical protein
MTDSWIDIAHQLREENDRLRAENARMKAMPEASEAVRAVVYGEEIDKLRAEVESWQEAFGLLTTLHGKMEINVSDPMGMAQAIERHVRAEVEALRDALVYTLATGANPKVWPLAEQRIVAALAAAGRRERNE